MDLNYLRKILKIIEDSNINEIEIEEGETKLKIVKKSDTPAGIAVSGPVNYAQPLQLQVPANPQVQPSSSSNIDTSVKVENKYHEIKSPIVGTFYKAPAPDAEPYVKVGQRISAGTVLCIIEAMKLMNEIESDVAGTIVKVCIDNGQPVEYNQVLFQIETD
jgi:acetyl-CoA carboxylase biotin carboxyl carrier protein